MLLMIIGLFLLDFSCVGLTQAVSSPCRLLLNVVNDHWALFLLDFSCVGLTQAVSSPYGLSLIIVG